MPGPWSWSCPPKGDHPRLNGCGAHEHHHSPAAADNTARLHQAEHAKTKGAPEAPKLRDDVAWGAYCATWQLPAVSMGGRRNDCAQCGGA